MKISKIKIPFLTNKRKSSNNDGKNIVSSFKSRLGIGTKIFLWYFISILIGSILLFIPELSIAEGQEALSFENAFFIITSSFSDTGLSPVNISENLNIFGQLVVLFCVWVGGIGLMVFKYLFIVLVFRRRASSSVKELLYTEKGGPEINSSEKMIQRSLLVFTVICIISSLIFSGYLYNGNNSDWGSHVGDNMNPSESYGQSLFYGLFHATSAVNNAGFDIFGGRSMEMFNHDMFFQTYTLVLFILGGIGFPILYDVCQTIWRKTMKLVKNKKERRTGLSLLSKITLVGYFSVMLFGLVVSLAGEAIFASHNSLNEGEVALFNDDNYTTAEKGMVVFFHTASSRSAGFSYYPIEMLSPTTKTLIGILMFIGAGPASTGGGVRVSAFLVVFLSLIRYRRSGSQLNIFKRTLHPDTRLSAFRTIITSAVFVMLIAFLIVMSSPGFDSNIQEGVFFETVSAFGTTGLSYGDTTASLNAGAKILLCIIMIIGQLGVSNVLTLFKTKGKAGKAIRQFPVERVFGI